MHWNAAASFKVSSSSLLIHTKTALGHFFVRYIDFLSVFVEMLLEFQAAIKSLYVWHRGPHHFLSSLIGYRSTFAILFLASVTQEKSSCVSLE